MRQAYDIYDKVPDDMLLYLRHNGWTFNRKACEWAVKRMKRRGTAKPVEMMDRAAVDNLLSKYGVTLEHNAGYDYVYVANMCLADYYESAVADEKHMAIFIKDTIDDIDAGEGSVMRCWYAKMISAGEPVDWDELV